MSQIAFDTLAYANKLKRAGVEPKIAEVHAQIQAEVLGEWMMTNVATKADVLANQTDIKELRLEIGQLRSETQLMGKELYSEINQIHSKINQIHSEIDQLRKEVKTDLKLLENRLTIRMGVMMTGIVGIIGTALKFIHI